MELWGQRIWVVLIWIDIAKLLSVAIVQAFTSARNLWRVPVSLHPSQKTVLASLFFRSNSSWKMMSLLRCTMALNAGSIAHYAGLVGGLLVATPIHFLPGLTPADKVLCARPWLSWHPRQWSSNEKTPGEMTHPSLCILDAVIWNLEQW